MNITRKSKELAIAICLLGTSILPLVSAAMPSGVNLLDNAGFEQNLDAWIAYPDVTISEDANSGQFSARIGGNRGGVLQLINVSPGENYQIYATAKMEADVGRAFVGFLFRDSNGRNMPGSTFNRVTTNEYREYVSEGIAPIGATQLMAFGWKSTEQGVLLVDDFFLTNNAEPPGGERLDPLYVSANFVVDSADELLQTVDHAKASGANAVVLSDTKVSSVAFSPQGADWESGIRTFIDGVKARDMKIYLSTVAMGYCSSMISTDTNLTTGYPIVDQPLKRQNNQLLPVKTTNLINGGFEVFSDNTPDGWRFQDAPGVRTFVDTQIKRSGGASMRLDAADGESSRIFATLAVKPFHQYTLKFWIKTQNITADLVKAGVRDANDYSRQLLAQHLSSTGSDGGRNYFRSTSNLSLDWTEIRLAFNSVEATEIDFFLAVFGGKGGSVWFDDVEIVDTPTLNWIVRDDLPRVLKSANANTYLENVDYQPIVDTKLGQAGYSGRYTTYHDSPVVTTTQSSSIAEGEVVYLNGYHAMVTTSGQVSCSWNDPEIYSRMRKIHETVYEKFQPDGVLLNYDEIRTGGYEPFDQAYATSGEALAASIRQALTDLNNIAPGVKHLFWSDMIDPYHNATRNYYHIANTLEGSWLGADPSQTILATWWSGQNLVDKGQQSLQFFSDLGFEQILGGFYDEEIGTNYRNWMNASEGVEGILGGMYTSWTSPQDFSKEKLEEFGELWWQ